MSLYKHDIIDLEHSAKANALIAGRMNTELTEKLVKGLIPPDMNRKADSISYCCITVAFPFIRSIILHTIILAPYISPLKRISPTAIWYFKKGLVYTCRLCRSLLQLAYSFEMLGRNKKDGGLTMEANSCFLAL